MKEVQDGDGQSTKITFTKVTACGNDFLIVEAREVAIAGFPADINAISQRLCDRHFGVGADGVEWLFPDANTDAMARLINSDGSEAEVSGNGTRCVAAEICSRTGQSKVVVGTGAGTKTCRLMQRQGFTFEFETNMGEPEIGVQLSIDTASGLAIGSAVSMGNPHFVIFVDEFPSGWQRQAAQIGKDSHFPRGTNVEYVVVRSASEIEIRLFERGAGETQSSGTGSCAAAVASIAAQRVQSPVKVIAAGGSQTVRWENQVYLQGPATIICRGEFFV